MTTKNNDRTTVTLTLKVSYDKDSVLDPAELAFLVENEFELAAVQSGVLTPSGRELIRQLDVSTVVDDD